MVICIYCLVYFAIKMFTIKMQLQTSQKDNFIYRKNINGCTELDWAMLPWYIFTRPVNMNFFTLWLIGRMNRQMNEQTGIAVSRVTFATEIWRKLALSLLAFCWNYINIHSCSEQNSNLYGSCRSEKVKQIDPLVTLLYRNKIFSFSWLLVPPLLLENGESWPPLAEWLLAAVL